MTFILLSVFVGVVLAVAARKRVKEFDKAKVWWEKKFHYQEWKAQLDEDIARLEHELDTVHHIASEDCVFCSPPVDGSKSFEEQLLNSGARVPLMVAPAKSAAPVKPPKPKLSNRELIEIYKYIDSVPFMSLEEGEEIEERNMAGDICVSYKTPDYVRCKICDNRELHKHDYLEARTVEDDVRDGLIQCTSCDKPGIHAHMWDEAGVLVD